MPDETTDRFRPREMVGTAVQRREDRSLVTGTARYTDDIEYSRTAHLAILGSQYAHARIESIDISDAAAADGVLAVYTYEDLVESGIDPTMPSPSLDTEDVGDDDPDENADDEDLSIDRPLLAGETVRYQGQPVAAVVADERYAAYDALDLVEVTYDRLESVVDIDTALTEDAPAIHETVPDNVGTRTDAGDEAATNAAFERAAHTVSVEVENNRIIPTAMEPRAAVARYQAADDELVVELSSQNPHSVQSWLSEVFERPRHRITVRVPDVGGGFGAKLQPYSGYFLTAWAAMEQGRPVTWQARRSEDFQSMVHGRRQRTEIEAALDDDGTITALRGHIDADLGGYPTTGGLLIPEGTASMLCGAYDVPTGYVSVRGAITNTAPISAYRGAGRPEATYIIERLLNACARELDIDPVAIRRRNFIPSDAFPVETALDADYDSGEYEKALDAALEMIDYDQFRERQRRAREEGRYLGIGFASYVEVCGGNSGDIESGSVRVNADGKVIAHTGTQDTGQGHETSYAQVLADELGVPFDDIRIVEGDTDAVTEGNGTGGSRSLAMAGNALRTAAREVVEKARRIAAHRLEAPVADVEFDDGEFHVTGAPNRTISFAEIAEVAYDPDDLSEDITPGLEASTYFRPDGSTAPFGTHAAVVEVDVETGEITIERYVAVDDVGPQVNPKLVEGQIHGGVAQGVGQARFEDGRYDESGNLATGSLQDYAVPKAHHLPDIEWDSTVTPSPNNPMGVKGVGEAGTIGSTPTVVNAALDALAPLGVDHLDMPLTDESVWTAIQAADE
jgi:carbon-monoxide dehydrogenase large subunit